MQCALTDVDAADINLVAAFVDVCSGRPHIIIIRAMSCSQHIISIIAVLILVVVVVVVLVRPVARRPLHLVFFLQSTSRVGKPRGDLRQRHLGDDGQHDLLAFGRVRVLDVFVEPRFQSARRLASCVLASYVQRPVTVQSRRNPSPPLQ